MVFTCLPSSVEVEQTVLGTDGLLAGCRAGMIHVDSTTADPSSTRRLAAEYAARGAAMVDAPMGRTPKEAEAGKLNTFIGGDPAALDRVRPIIACYADTVVEAGPIGSGHTLKLVNNFISVGTSAVIAEAVATAAKLGVDLNKLYEVVSSGGANSAMFQMMMPWVLEGDDSKLKGPLRIAGKGPAILLPHGGGRDRAGVHRAGGIADLSVGQCAREWRTVHSDAARHSCRADRRKDPGVAMMENAVKSGIATRRHVVGHDGI